MPVGFEATLSRRRDHRARPSSPYAFIPRSSEADGLHQGFIRSASDLATESWQGQPTPTDDETLTPSPIQS